MSDVTPNPGSPAAIARKCKCDPRKNSYGKGAYVDANRGPMFFVAPSCELHAEPTAPEPMDAETGDLWG